MCATLTPVLQACGIDGQVRRAPAMAAAMLVPSAKLIGGFRVIFVYYAIFQLRPYKKWIYS